MWCSCFPPRMPFWVICLAYFLTVNLVYFKMEEDIIYCFHEKGKLLVQSPNDFTWFIVKGKSKWLRFDNFHELKAPQNRKLQLLPFLLNYFFAYINQSLNELIEYSLAFNTNNIDSKTWGSQGLNHDIDWEHERYIITAWSRWRKKEKLRDTCFTLICGCCSS